MRTQLSSDLVQVFATIVTGFTWNEGATIVAAFGAAAIAAIIAVIGYGRQRRAERRAEQASLYGHAIAAVEDYLEGPYRIRRRADATESRFAITSAISNTKTAISLHQALLEMHAPTAVSDAYNAFVAAAQREAGPQMTGAWNTHPTTADEHVPLGKPYGQSASDAARATLIITMRADLGSFD